MSESYKVLQYDGFTSPSVASCAGNHILRSTDFQAFCVTQFLDTDGNGSIYLRSLRLGPGDGIIAVSAQCTNHVGLWLRVRGAGRTCVRGVVRLSSL